MKCLFCGLETESKKQYCNNTHYKKYHNAKRKKYVENKHLNKMILSGTTAIAPDKKMQRDEFLKWYYSYNTLTKNSHNQLIKNEG